MKTGYLHILRGNIILAKHFYRDNLAEVTEIVYTQAILHLGIYVIEKVIQR